MTVVEVFADIGCPFTHVGLRRLVEERARRGRPDVVLRVRAWPLELVNGAPLEPGFVAHEIEALRRQVAPELFTRFDPDAFPATSVPALALAAVALAAGDAVGEAVSLELRDRLFERGERVDTDAVLDAVARDHGLARPDPTEAAQLVAADHAEGIARGVVGSPHFFVADGSYFCPALTIHRDDEGEFVIRPDEEGFAQLCARAFGAG